MHIGLVVWIDNMIVIVAVNSFMQVYIVLYNTDLGGREVNFTAHRAKVIVLSHRIKWKSAGVVVRVFRHGLAVSVTF